MTSKPRIAIVIGSTRPGRYADKAASWMLKQTQAIQRHRRTIQNIASTSLMTPNHPMPMLR